MGEKTLFVLGGWHEDFAWQVWDRRGASAEHPLPHFRWQPLAPEIFSENTGRPEIFTNIYRVSSDQMLPERNEANEHPLGSSSDPEVTYNDEDHVLVGRLNWTNLLTLGPLLHKDFTKRKSAGVRAAGVEVEVRTIESQENSKDLGAVIL